MKRRTFSRAACLLSLAPFAGCRTGFAPSAGTPRSASGEAPDILGGDALDQAARIRSGAVSPVEMVEAAIRRIETLDVPINAVVTRFYQRALEEAAGPLPDGPFRGVPFLLKDLNDLAGTPKSMGSRLFADYRSAKSSPHTEAVVGAGFVVLGKTNTPELGLVATTESAALGPCHNPWNLAHSAGGSSGGAAAAVAAGMLPMAQASDGGGSIRVPSSCCGVFGLKPSRGRNRAAPQKRAVDISVKHCVSRSVRDTAAYSVVVQRRDATAPFAPLPYVEGPSADRLRIGFFTSNVYGVDAEPSVKDALEDTARLCDGLGHEIVPVTLDFEGEAFREHFLNLWSSIPAGVLERVESQGLDPTSVLEPVTLGMAERFRRARADAIPRAAAFFAGYGARVDAYFQEFDLLLSPVLRRPPIPLGEQAGTLPFDDVFEPMIDYVSFTPVWNATGHPAMSVPLGWSPTGLPIGSQFVAGLGREQRLLELAFELEAARPWADRRPPG
ncbi:MAG: amidase [Deltaproteobacteria bacterium]|nr:amidase [Deltaproteobacteria bacterium]